MTQKHKRSEKLAISCDILSCVEGGIFCYNYCKVWWYFTAEEDKERKNDEKHEEYCRPVLLIQESKLNQY